MALGFWALGFRECRLCRLLRLLIMYSGGDLMRIGMQQCIIVVRGSRSRTLYDTG